MSEDKPRYIGFEFDPSTAVVPGAMLGLLSGAWKFRTWKQLPTDHPIYNAIGRIASEWAYYEYVLDEIIRFLLPAKPELVTSVTAQVMGVTNRFNAITALCTVYGVGKSVHDKIKSITNQSYEVQDRRNRLVHDPWFLDPETMETAQFKSMPRKELKYGVKAVEAEYIDTTLTLIADRIREAHALRERIEDELIALRHRPPKPQLSSLPPWESESDG